MEIKVIRKTKHEYGCKSHLCLCPLGGAAVPIVYKLAVKNRNKAINTKCGEKLLPN